MGVEHHHQWEKETVTVPLPERQKWLQETNQPIEGWWRPHHNQPNGGGWRKLVHCSQKRGRRTASAPPPGGNGGGKWGMVDDNGGGGRPPPPRGETEGNGSDGGDDGDGGEGDDSTTTVLTKDSHNTVKVEEIDWVYVVQGLPRPPGQTRTRWKGMVGMDKCHRCPEE